MTAVRGASHGVGQPPPNPSQEGATLAPEWRTGPIAVSGALALAVATFCLPEPLRAVAVVPLALGLPGWVTVRAALGRDVALPALQAVALSVMVSAAEIILLDVATAAVGFRVTRDSTLVTVVLLVLALTAAAVRSERRALEHAPQGDAVPTPPRSRRGPRPIPRTLAVADVVILAVAVVGVLMRALPAPAPQPYSALHWTSATLEHGAALTVPATGSAALGVVLGNVTKAPETVSLGTGTSPTPADVVIQLRPDEVWQGTVSVPVAPTGCSTVTVHATSIEPLGVAADPVDSIGTATDRVATGLDGHIAAQLHPAGTPACQRV